MGIPQIGAYTVPTRIELNREPLRWAVEREKAALLIHDMQNYFLRPFESESFVHSLVARIDSVRRQCHRLGIPTFYSAQPSGQSRRERGLLADVWGPGITSGGDAGAITKGLELVDGKDQLITKRRYSAFKGSNLGERLACHGRSQLIICGVYAHIGCLATALDAFMSDIKPFVVADCLADFSLEHHRMALSHVGHCVGRILSSAELLDELGGSHERMW